MTNYSNPDVLVTTEWVKQNLGKPGIKLVEVDVDTKAYDAGHIPGSIGFNWQTELQDQLRRDILSKAQLEQLLGSRGISNQDTIVLYGDNNNWFAAYAFWLFRVYGHRELKLINGGRGKWLAEEGNPPPPQPPALPPGTFAAGGPHLALRTRGADVL